MVSQKVIDESYFSAHLLPVHFYSITVRTISPKISNFRDHVIRDFIVQCLILQKWCPNQFVQFIINLLKIPLVRGEGGRGGSNDYSDSSFEVFGGMNTLGVFISMNKK